MKTTTTILALSLLTACGASQNAANVKDDAAAPAAPTPASIDAAQALKLMQTASPVDSDVIKADLVKVDLSTLPAPLSTRFSKAKAALEDFAFIYSDMGDTDSGVAYVLSAPGASQFVGYAVYAEGGDDRGGYSTSAVAYYDVNGDILDMETRSAGQSDSEEAGDWSHVDSSVISAETATLKAALTWDAAKQQVSVAQGLEKVQIASVPFSALIKSIETGIEAQTFFHTDMGDDGTVLYSVKNADGSLAGYILISEGGDDADRWATAGYALFSAGGQFLDRGISTAGLSDNMGDDDLVPAASNN